MTHSVDCRYKHLRILAKLHTTCVSSFGSIQSYNREIGYRTARKLQQINKLYLLTYLSL